MQDEFHPAADYFQFLPSNRRLKHFKGSKRFIDSFYPHAVRALMITSLFSAFCSLYICIYFYFSIFFAMFLNVFCDC